MPQEPHPPGVKNHGHPGMPIFAKPVIVQDDGHFRQAIQEIRLLGHFHLHVLEIPRSSVLEMMAEWTMKVISYNH